MKKGDVTLNQVKKGMKADPKLILQAIGWLAREDKFFDFEVWREMGPGSGGRVVSPLPADRNWPGIF
jgi:hypothetical protein